MVESPPVLEVRLEEGHPARWIWRWAVRKPGRSSIENLNQILWKKAIIPSSRILCHFLIVNGHALDDKYLSKCQDVWIRTLENINMELISGEKGKARDWLIQIFISRMPSWIPSGKNQAGVIGAPFWHPESVYFQSGKNVGWQPEFLRKKSQ